MDLGLGEGGLTPRMLTPSEAEKKFLGILGSLESLSDIQAAGIVRRDGLMIASSLPKEMDARTIAAMTAAIVGTAETCTAELHLGRFLQVIIEAEKGKLIATGAGGEAILFCLVSASGNLGLVLLEMGRAAQQVSSQLEEI